MSDVSIRASIVGVDRINALVEDLRGIDRNKAVRHGLLQGAKVIMSAGRTNLRKRNDEHTGNLMRSFRAKLARRQLSAYAGFQRSGAFFTEGGGNHAHLVDLGTVGRYTKAGLWRGIMPASYFWTEAKTGAANLASRRIEEGVVRMVETLTNKYAI